MKVKSCLAIIFIALLFQACNGLNNDAPQTSEVTLQQKDIQKEEELNKTPMDSATTQAGTKEKKQPSSNIDWDKKIIRTAHLSIEIKDYKRYSTDLNALVKRYGGYIATEQETKNDDRIENRVTIKVPVGEFQEVMTAINNSGEKIIDRKISSEDVTTEVIDTKSRIQAKKNIRQRYIDFLQQAKSMEDILQIQSEINEVQEEIEMAAGRVEYLNHSSAYSTIELYYFQILKASATNDKPTFGSKVSDAFMGGWEVLKHLLLVVVTIWPVWIICILGFIFYRRRKQVLTGKGSVTA